MAKLAIRDNLRKISSRWRLDRPGPIRELPSTRYDPLKGIAGGKYHGQLCDDSCPESGLALDRDTPAQQPGTLPDTAEPVTSILHPRRIETNPPVAEVNSDTMAAVLHQTDPHALRLGMSAGIGEPLLGDSIGGIFSDGVLPRQDNVAVDKLDLRQSGPRHWRTR